MSEQKMREALELADAALSGANMNMDVVERKVKAALAQQPGAVLDDVLQALRSAMGDVSASSALTYEKLRVVERWLSAHIAQQPAAVGEMTDVKAAFNAWWEAAGWYGHISKPIAFEAWMAAIAKQGGV